MKKLKIIAILAAAATGLCIYLFLQKLSEPQEIPKTSVVVASVNIKENTVITSDMLTYSAIPTEAVLSGSTTDITEIIGKATNSDILAGEQILLGRLVEIEKGDATDTMAYTVAKGMRAATVTVNETSGVAGMLKPGNRIDIVWIHYPETVTIDEATSEEVRNSELEVTVLFEDVKILAVDGVMAKSGSAEGYSTLTLELLPEEVLNLYYAMNTGSLTAMLRNSVDSEPLDIVPVTGENMSDAISGNIDDNGDAEASPNSRRETLTSPEPSPSPSPETQPVAGLEGAEAASPEATQTAGGEEQ